MKGRAGLERVGDWVQTYGWSIPVFALGYAFGAALVSGAGWLEPATAFGTLAAAVAAFLSIAYARGVQRRRDRLEDAARRPNFQILLEDIQLFETPNQQPTYRFRFANMSQGFILLRQTVISGPQPHYWGPDYPDRQGPLVPEVSNLILAPGEIKEKVINLIEVQRLGRTALYFYFHHSVTGPLFYRLKLPVYISRNGDTGRREVSFLVYEQEVEGPVLQPFDIAGVTPQFPKVEWEQ